MSRENVEIVRRINEQLLATGELALDLMHEDIEVLDYDAPDQDEYRGHAGVAQWLEDWGAAWDTWSYEPERYIDAGDVVVLFTRTKAKGLASGIELDREEGLIYKLHDGKIARIEYYNDRDQALEAAGLQG
ncbi:MAG TPA: nuclear transport factor 2 family protein [Solirubrobacteraceae bacterium]|nr:nuclear transport factor 2 family protein [Solirubrobacteraceae bacterium]